MKLWKKKLTRILNANSQLIETEKGPIEYAIVGNGPVVVGFHGTPGGYDQIICLAEELPKHHFELIGWSRPGYLRTPLSAGKTIEEQADCLFHLLNHLKIDKVALLALSGGGPYALKFALKYPEKVWGIILQSAIALPFSLHLTAAQKIQKKLLFNDFGFWLYHLLVHFYPRIALKYFFQQESKLDAAKIQEKIKRILANPKKLDFFEKLIQSMSPISKRKRGFLNDMLNFNSLEELPLEKILCPVLAIHAVEDNDVPLEHAEHIIRKISHANLLKVKDEGHILNFSNEFPDIQDQIINFLKKSFSTSNRI